MRPQVARPETMPPGVRRLAYAIFCWLNRHPGVWRAVGWVLRRWPAISHVLPFAAQRRAVQQVLNRPRSFSSTSHTANLIAGEFLIGMDAGPTYDADKRLFDSILKGLGPTLRDDADLEARTRIAQILAGPRRDGFDLIDDYLMWVVFAAIKPAFASAADNIVSGTGRTVPDEETTRHFLHEIRHVAAHLFAGRLAPLEKRQRAEIGASSLRSRVGLALRKLSGAWPGANGLPLQDVFRNAVGLAWVSHPVTAQSGALAFQELLGRPEVYAALRAHARRLEDAVWTDSDFRAEVRVHVLELMRFRPIFPLLARDVPRATEYKSGARTNAKCPAGSSLTVLSISASFDTHDMSKAAQFCPHRDWGTGPQADMQFMMFGFGERRCPAREHAADMLTSAFIGLLTLQELQWADRWGSRITYDGPLITRMRLRIAEQS